MTKAKEQKSTSETAPDDTQQGPDTAPEPTQEEIQQQEINAACETLCDKLEEVNPTQARIVRALYRDKLPSAQLRNVLKMPEHVISQQRGFAMKALVDIVTGGVLRQWATPRSQVPGIGESANKASDQGKSDNDKGNAAA